MTKPNDGGPLFPHKAKIGEYGEIESSGATLLDYFAGQALSALIIHTRFHSDCGSSPPIQELIAKMSFNYAQAMIEERERKRG